MPHNTMPAPDPTGDPEAARYVHTMECILRAIAQDTTHHHRPADAQPIDLSNADYNLLLRWTRWHPAGSTDPAEWICANPETAPREGTLFGRSLRAVDDLEEGRYRLAGNTYTIAEAQSA